MGSRLRGNDKSGASFPSRQRGAVLLLLLAVLGLAGASLLIGALGGSNPQARYAQRTVRLIAQANDALVGFATTNGRLPRPAISATDGRENPAPCASDEQCAGILPWVTLGVDGTDAWGKRLRYSVTPELTTFTYQPSSAVATRTVQRRGADGQLSYLAGGATCSVQTQCAALVVLSHGKNNYGVSVTGIAQANTGQDNTDEENNAGASAHFISRVASTDTTVPGGEFDDLLAWVPLDLLYRRMRAARTLPN
ncbi:MAG: hypothetical protein V4724_03765 [Pseudomonadota bacterium]